MPADNERLHTGKQVSWQPDVATVVLYDIGPGSTEIDEKNRYQGWEQLLEKLKQVEAFVRPTTPSTTSETKWPCCSDEKASRRRAPPPVLCSDGKVVHNLGFAGEAKAA
ncbi:hypothetical protein LTR15_012513 [Elasticomyces elasticus]|nr:hypothetical protein LTR15_012513 [Elasticomyces elasticus]